MSAFASASAKAAPSSMSTVCTVFSYGCFLTPYMPGWLRWMQKEVLFVT
jgi:hypothetical protein